MAEEEIGRGARGGRAAAKPGSGIGLKVGLIAAVATLVLTAAAVLASSAGGPKGDPEREFVERGLGYARVLAAPDSTFWLGTSGPATTDGLKQTRRALSELFGETGTVWWDETVQEVSEPNFSGMDPEEQKAATDAREKFLKAKDKLSKASSEADPGHAARIQNAVAKAASGPAVYAAWVRQVAPDFRREMDFVASHPGKTAVVYDFSKATYEGKEFHLPGQMNTGGGIAAVRVFGSPITSTLTKPMMAYVAVPESAKAQAAGAGSPLGWILVILAPLIVGFAAAAAANAHAKNVKDLARDIDRLGTAGDPARAIRAHGAEASAVAKAVERMVANLQFRSQHGSADLEEIVEKERKVVEEIHGALMAKNPPRLSDYEVETLFKPGFEIGGDHFEYFRIDANHLGLILLDTNVRGVPAALVMSTTKAYVRAAAPGNLSPSEVLKQVNRHLAGELPPGRHVTALYAVIDTAGGKANVASAGHLPLIVYRHATGKVAKLNPEGIALGLDVGPVFERALQEGEVSIGVGDRIVLYTDGALKVQNEGGEEFGELRFYQAVAREAPKNSQAFVNFVGSAIDQFHLTTPQNDDITISTVKRLK
jgi:serine phosphatase RsbU (regulator of sigma subunit)